MLRLLFQCWATKLFSSTWTSLFYVIHLVWCLLQWLVSPLLLHPYLFTFESWIYDRESVILVFSFSFSTLLLPFFIFSCVIDLSRVHQFPLLLNTIALVMIAMSFSLFRIQTYSWDMRVRNYSIWYETFHRIAKYRKMNFVGRWRAREIEVFERMILWSVIWLDCWLVSNVLQWNCPLIVWLINDTLM